MTRAKSSLIGIFLIILGAFPLILKIKSISDSLSAYTLLSYLQPGGLVYQIIIVILGVLLIWQPRPRYYHPR